VKTIRNSLTIKTMMTITTSFNLELILDKENES